MTTKATSTKATNTQTTPTQLSLDEKIDLIAKGLPDDVRAEYFRVMVHCRQLPKNDELLLILNALKILTFLIDQVPAKLVAEREKLEKLFKDALGSLAEMLRSSRDYQEQLDAKLRELPKGILNGLNPAAFAAKINERLQEQFILLELPQTSRSLSTFAGDVKRTTSEFKAAADKLESAYRGATASAERSIREMKSSIGEAIDRVTSSTTKLAAAIETKHWRTVAVIALLTLVLGFALGIFIGSQMRS